MQQPIFNEGFTWCDKAQDGIYCFKCRHLPEKSIPRSQAINSRVYSPPEQRNTRLNRLENAHFTESSEHMAKDCSESDSLEQHNIKKRQDALSLGFPLTTITLLAHP